MMELSLRISLSLLILLGIGWGVLRFAWGPMRRGRIIALLGRQQLTRGSAVALVRVADRALVLGVTDHQVTLLTETDLGTVADASEMAKRPAAPAGSALSPATWRQALNVLRDRTVRRS
ncbi:MAG: flagellar biosynthetic protein FliO [Micromonosporaceae bacterium]|nr:flagellar biosynthetic protein FliO [Micromonosporaceae bacterium]